MIKAWTDRSFISLGDSTDQLAPVREVVVTDYDGKLCTVIVGGVVEQVRPKDLYTKPRRTSKEFALTKEILKELRQNV